LVGVHQRQQVRRRVVAKKNLEGDGGAVVRACLSQRAGNHPELLTRQDWLLTGIYRMIRDIRTRLCPSFPPVDDVEDLPQDWLSDVFGSHLLDAEDAAPTDTETF